MKAEAKEGHIDFLDTPLGLITHLGLQLYSQKQIGKREEG
jgi:bacterioferritin (cytochrome b1)